MTDWNDLRFAFDVRGYVHLRGVLSRDEIAEITRWMNDAEGTDVAALNADRPQSIPDQLNRPFSRILDADPRFAFFLDHPAITPLLIEFLGADYKHIDNDLYYTYPGYKGGGWHRGVRADASGHVVDGRFTCPMVKAFFCMTDVGSGEGEFVVVPGSHKTLFSVAENRVNLPAQHVFDDVRAGDVILFDEALLHNGRPNISDKMRKTIIVNFGREDAGAWPGYAPFPHTLHAVTPRQREILTNRVLVWQEP